MKLNRRTTLAGAAALAAGSLSRAAFAQAYPNKPIKIVVPFAAGSATGAPLALVQLASV